MYLLMMVLDDISYRDDVLKAWMDAGIRGVTVLESTGVNRVLQRTEARPMYMGFGQMFGGGQVGNNTLLALIPSLELAEAAVQATEAVIGPMDDPNTGIAFALPVSKSWGLSQP